ncbi:alpha/beta hydrolase family protein [Metabacillus sp. RGM 3146]|uniref:alpha/beta hydrolase family protein n=1 Tax=Metabacillus sp. RGM 3146 TaxID=3401092 RepID=UPI003B99BBCF
MPYLLEKLEQAGLPPLISQSENEKNWQQKMLAIKKTWKNIVKELASPLDPIYQIISEEKEKKHVRRKIIYQTGDGDQVTANLLIPLDTAFPCPAVLALHPTEPLGKDDISHPRGRKSRRYGMELADRGYIVLAPDCITAGERVKAGAEPFQTRFFYADHPEWTAAGKMISDHIQGIELLCNLEEVDSERIGAIGHSLGGYNSFFLSSLDSRVKAVVCSCGLSVFTGDPEQNRWGKRDWFSHFPELTPLTEAGEIPFEFHEILSLHAPRPLFVWMTMNDAIFPHWQRIAEGLGHIDQLYRLLGENEKFDCLIGNKGHDFPSDIREFSYEFLNKWL